MRFWIAHWDLPSVQQGFEMFHRGVIDEPELFTLLRAKDIPQVWRERFRDIAFAPFTRVDLRRMLKAGIISEADVLRGYKDIGYDDAKARALTDFAVAWATPDDRSELDDRREIAAGEIRLSYRRHVIDRVEALDLLVEAGYIEADADFLLALDDTRLAKRPDLDADVDVRELTVSVIRRAFRKGLWDRARAMSELEVLGFLPNSADLLLSLDELAMQEEITDLQEDVTRDLYLAGAIDQATAVTELDGLGFTPERRDLTILRWNLRLARKDRRLSVGQVREALREKVIDEAEAFDRLTRIGYTDRDAQILIATA